MTIHGTCSRRPLALAFSRSATNHSVNSSSKLRLVVGFQTQFPGPAPFAGSIPGLFQTSVSTVTKWISPASCVRESATQSHERVSLRATPKLDGLGERFGTTRARVEVLTHEYHMLSPDLRRSQTPPPHVWRDRVNPDQYAGGGADHWLDGCERVGRPRAAFW